jgi:hypothetical protein
MPTPKEFKDAIESLSPEQRRFCKPFRSMQLASSLPLRRVRDPTTSWRSS